MRFAKYHGTGNDFVMVEDLDDTLRLDRGVIAALCDRHRGVGADGLIRIVAADDADFEMDYFNADGNPAEMCGNGVRCLAKYVYDRGLASSREIDVRTGAGLKRLVVESNDGLAMSVSVDMGPPSFERGVIPMVGEPSDTFLQQPLDIDGRTYEATALSMGNPHCVVFLGSGDDLGSLDVRAIGSSVENRDWFPQRTNVEFVKAVDGRIHARVWERGSGETLACGTGACAALVACSRAGLTGPDAEVVFPGGLLRLSWHDGGAVVLTGPATCVFDGELDSQWLASAAGGTA